MKKLIYTIIIGATMVCCQSEDNTVEELQETETTETQVNCLSALVTGGELDQVFDYWRNIQGMDGVTVRLNHTQEHQLHCFDVSEYTTEQMIQMVKDKY